MNPAVQQYVSKAQFPSEKMTLTEANGRLTLAGRGKIYPAEAQLDALPLYLRPFKGRLKDGIEVEVTTELTPWGNILLATGYGYAGVGLVDQQVINFINSKLKSQNINIGVLVRQGNVNKALTNGLRARGVNLSDATVGIQDGQLGMTLSK